MCTGPTDFDVTMGRMQNQQYFQGVYCVYCNNNNCVKTMACGVAINSLEISLDFATRSQLRQIGLPYRWKFIGKLKLSIIIMCFLLMHSIVSSFTAYTL